MKHPTRNPSAVARLPEAANRFGSIGRALVLGALFVVTAVAAPAADAIVSQLSALKHVVRTDADGKVIEEYVPFTTVIPGDTLLCTVEYTNNGATPAARMIVTLPVPPEMTLVPASAQHQDTETAFSVDGGSTFAALDQLSVTENDGTVRPARADDVNSVRWILRTDLAPGATGKVSYLATLK